MGKPAQGLTVGLGDLYVSPTANKPGTNAFSLFAACVCIALAGLFAVLSVVLLFAVCRAQ